MVVCSSAKRNYKANSSKYWISLKLLIGIRKSNSIFQPIASETPALSCTLQDEAVSHLQDHSHPRRVGTLSPMSKNCTEPLQRPRHRGKEYLWKPMWGIVFSQGFFRLLEGPIFIEGTRGKELSPHHQNNSVVTHNALACLSWIFIFPGCSEYSSIQFDDIYYPYKRLAFDAVVRQLWSSLQILGDIIAQLSAYP